MATDIIQSAMNATELFSELEHTADPELPVTLFSSVSILCTYTIKYWLFLWEYTIYIFKLIVINFYHLSDYSSNHLILYYRMKRRIPRSRTLQLEHDHLEQKTRPKQKRAHPFLKEGNSQDLFSFHLSLPFRKGRYPRCHKLLKGRKKDPFSKLGMLKR